jgi:hypothetical protein
LTDHTVPEPKVIDDWTEDEILLPVQLTRHAPRLREPERRLRLAVLEDAIRYFQRYLHATDKRGRALYEDALDWFASPDRSEPFSLENVCDALGVDAEYVRGGLRRWRDAELARVASPPRLRGIAGGLRRWGRGGRTSRKAA